MSKLTELLLLPGGEITKMALGLDIRSGQNIEELEQILNNMDEQGQEYEILFLEANDAALVKRYKETRRNHPLAGGGRVEKGIAEARRKIGFLKKRADYILDTSRLLTRELKSELRCV